MLNCENYFFNEYAAGADILMQDTYTVGINATFSPVWHTACNTTYGDCGCDNCRGAWEDVSTRMDEFVDRLEWTGRGLETAVWAVPQAFGASQCVDLLLCGVTLTCTQVLVAPADRHGVHPAERAVDQPRRERCGAPSPRSC